MGSLSCLLKSDDVALWLTHHPHQRRDLRWLNTARLNCLWHDVHQIVKITLREQSGQL